MAKQKATDIASFKKQFRDEGGDKEAVMLSHLPDDLKSLYENLMHTTWAPIESIAVLYQAVAETIFPKDPDQIAKTGKLAAEKSFTGVYKSFLRVPTVASIKQRIGMIWNTYHAQGKLVVENEGTNSIELRLDEYPDMPVVLRKITTGHLWGIFELAGVRDVSVKLDDANSSSLRWKVAWNE